MHLVIIGNGITGVTCALKARRLQPEARITLVSAESAHHFSRTALMYVYMGHMRYQDIKPYEDWFWDENRLELVHATATGLDADRKAVQLSTGRTLAYDQLLLATGSVGRARRLARRSTWPACRAFVHPARPGAMTRDTQQGISRGRSGGRGPDWGGAGRNAARQGHPGHVLVRDARYWGAVLPPEEADLVQRQLNAHHIVTSLRNRAGEILGDEHGRVRAVQTTAGEELPCQWVGLAIGVQPNLTLARAAGLETDKGILVDEHLQTSAARRVRRRRLRPAPRSPGAGEVAVEQLWYTGRHAGRNRGPHPLRADAPRPYRRGIWFNSAKFFNLEYQTYGRVPAEPTPG